MGEAEEGRERALSEMEQEEMQTQAELVNSYFLTQMGSTRREAGRYVTIAIGFLRGEATKDGCPC